MKSIGTFLVALSSLAPEAAPAAEEILIAFPSGDARIAASLFLPPGRGPHPAAVFLHGSGAHTRAAQRPYAELFLDAGVGVLLSDKRGSGESTGDWQRASIETLARDAVAGIAALRNRTDVDGSRIGLFGGSQAGWVAPVAGAIDGRVAFFVIASGGGIRPADNERWAYERALDRRGASERDRDRARDLLDRYFDYLATGRGRGELEAAVAAVEKEDWYGALDLRRVLPSDETRAAWSWVATFDPLPLVTRMSAPTLLLFGGQDHVQPTELAVARWREGLEAARNRRYEIRIFPEADHFLRVGAGGEHGSAAHGAGPAAPFVEALPAFVRHWLQENVVKETR